MSVFEHNDEQPDALPVASASEHRLIEKRIRLRIDKEYHQEPVISRLVSNFQLTVNISAALLSSEGGESGWFDLELRGTEAQIDSALVYLSELDLETWPESAPEVDGW